MTTLCEATPFAAVPLAVLVGPSGFRGDARFERGLPLAGLGVEEAPDEPPVDPLTEAWSNGHAAGRAEALIEAEAMIAAADAARASLALALQRIDAAQANALQERLRAAVAALCESALAPLALDVNALVARAQRAVSVIARADEAVTVAFHPEDLPLVAPKLGGGWKVEADASLERGALRVEGLDGGVEDGPEQWCRAIAEALSAC